MNRAILGVLMALVFVVLESAQFVFFGGLFQRMSSFLFGFLVFGITVIGFVGWTALRNPRQIEVAISNPLPLIGVNVAAALAFAAYLTSVQLVEPAITYTISAGAMPITTYILYRFGVGEGEAIRNRMEAGGNLLLLCGIVYLSIITVAGWSGFVRGDWRIAATGVLLAIVDGVAFTWVLVYSQRLSRLGIGPGAVLGLRLPLYVLVAGGCVVLRVDGTDSPGALEIAWFVLIGFLLTAPPLYTLQTAISMISTLTISALTALGPFVIFSLQLLEGRVDYSPATLAGLSIYFAGALSAAFGAVRATSQNQP